MLSDFGVVDLLQQLGVLVDKPRFPQDVGCCVLDLKRKSGCRSLAMWDFTETLAWLCHEPVLQEHLSCPSWREAFSFAPTRSPGLMMDSSRRRKRRQSY